MSTHGQLAQFTDAAALVRATKQLHALGYTRLEAFSPYPVGALDDVLGVAPSRLPWAMFAAGMAGGFGTLVLQYIAAVLDYPIDAGGRPPASWPAFVPNAIEVAILLAVVAGVIAFLRGCRLPTLHHPLFDIAWFEDASADGFLLLLRADDPRWDPVASPAQVGDLAPLRHAAVPA
ncbi:DUF3341 domain-containing protein [Luteibacter sp. 9135]|uniref:DUF3341 domain-containing protein n=1 Tax=Luteibacter sp. 9135 TaxID=1500893 RepID=UPI00055A937C|nr:DUF3341 domain-containing protein [Luteibacter sp. 9135]